VTRRPADQVGKDLEVLAEVLLTLRTQTPEVVAERDLARAAMEGLLAHLDPHSQYFDAERFATMREDQKSSFHGIGIHIGTDQGQLVVVAPIPDTPAARAGIRAGDRILAIDGKETRLFDADEAIRLLRGEKGQPVRLLLGRPGVLEPLSIELSRDVIPSETVRLSLMLDGQTGYVALRDFGEKTSEELIAALVWLETLGMRRTILDLRGNPGGLLPQAIEVAGLFLPGEKPLVSTRGRTNSANQVFHSREASAIGQLPLIVLIDRGSASASEIVAGAIQDHDRGLVLGTTSWGKGLVQSVFPLGNGSHALALTTARYYTPSGRNIQGSYTSWESYFTEDQHEDLYFEPASVGLAPSQIFSTFHGRRVLQVRGIVPDVYLEAPPIPQEWMQLEIEENIFYEFAVLHQDRIPRDGRQLPQEKELLAAFGHFLKENGGPTSEGLLLQNSQYALQQLRYQMLFVVEPRKAWEYQTRIDPCVLSAIELMDPAAELLRVHLGKGPLPEGYMDGLLRYARSHRVGPKLSGPGG
jgi:carboxyl-terminal processing protease